MWVTRTSNLNTISLMIWFGKVRKIGYLKAVRIAVQCCWQLWKKVEQRCSEKVNVSCWYWLVGWEGTLGSSVLPPGTCVVLDNYRSDSEIRGRICFLTIVLNSERHSWTLLNHFFPKGLSKECGLIKLGNSKVCRRHGNHYSVPFNWV